METIENSTGLPRVFEVQAFTMLDHKQGRTRGWRLYSRDWHRRMSGLTWAWFWRTVNE